MLKWHLRRVHFSFLHISLILSGIDDCSRSGTREWILILGTRHPILHNTWRSFWSIRRINTLPKIEMCQLVNPKAYWTTILSPPQRLQDPVNHPLIHTMCPAMMKNTSCLTMWLKQHPDEAITQHAYYPPPSSIWIHRLKRQETGGKLIQISMITTQTKWRLSVHFGYRT